MRHLLPIGAVVLVVCVRPAAAEQSAPLPERGAAAPLESREWAVYERQITALEERMDAIQRRVDAVRDRAAAFKDLVVHPERDDLLATERVLRPATLDVRHRNDLGWGFVLKSAKYVLDGEVIFDSADRERLNGEVSVVVYRAAVLAGLHRVTAELVYRGDGGFFSYVDGYLFRVGSEYSFTLEEGRAFTLDVVGYDKAGVFAALDERPGIRFDLAVGSGR